MSASKESQATMALAWLHEKWPNDDRRAADPATRLGVSLRTVRGVT
ncbi:MAG: hypothetical protein IPG25_19355 [Proteobacteria bacterium]|nr:hypothetical protein [Pseudomonadota bacterium]